MSRQALSIRRWWPELLLIAGLGAVFYFILGLGVKSIITQQFSQQQQTLARAQAANITSFFEVFGNSIAVLAQLSSMERADTKTMQDMDVFVEQWRASDLVGGVALTDRHGTVLFNSNVLGTRDIGASLADRDYYAWAKNQQTEKEYFIGQSVVSRLGASEGQVIVPVASPVHREDVFVGVVVASVKLQPLTERYLELMKVSDLTSVYLTDDRGELLYSNSTELLPEIKNLLNPTDEGTFKSKEHLIASSPISLGSQNWLLVIASPAQEVVNLAMPFYLRQLALLLFVSLTILLFGILVTQQYRPFQERLK